MGKVISGTEIKLNIDVEPMGDYTLADYNFDVYLVGGGFKKTVLTFSKKGHEISKGLTLAEDGKSCIVTFNTADIGQGAVTAQIKAYIPDVAFEDRVRTEIIELNTGIDVVKGIV